MTHLSPYARNSTGYPEIRPRWINTWPTPFCGFVCTNEFFRDFLKGPRFYP